MRPPEPDHRKVSRQEYAKQLIRRHLAMITVTATTFSQNNLPAKRR
ncbi:hypothetical protein CO2235_200142 [Cupriavidus oxalaticus]|uniref:Uncharacterized protein n=1 Tax=Cupriavidus oxalaticus TaxID=96344 RepID=A0A976GA01_9BURK|nr:hypothetical protein CO2235_200142 [Cupriavidus oxalaticus]